MLVIISNNTICIPKLFAKCRIRTTFLYLLIFGLKSLEMDPYPIKANWRIHGIKHMTICKLLHN